MKYAEYDHTTAASQQVMGWWDTDEYDYPNLPDAANLLELTDEQWNNRFDTPLVAGGVLSVASPLTAAQLLGKVKLDKIAGIKLACGLAIVSGITSNTLGAVFAYPTSRDDQANLNGLTTESLLPGSGDEYKFWCADADGVWARRIHTKLQIQELGKAVADHVKTQQGKYEQKLTEIASADAVAVELIMW